MGRPAGSHRRPARPHRRRQRHRLLRGHGMGPGRPVAGALGRRCPRGPVEDRVLLVGSNVWGPDIAGIYDDTYSAMFDAPRLDPVLVLLSELAGEGSALEFAVGTGRVALPLSQRGVPVAGIELSPHMAE